MLLKKIKLSNFRQYIGNQEIIFSTDNEKNVTLLLGENTSGKTTFVQAFRWILYNDSDFVGSKRNTTLIINDNVRRSMRVGDKKTVFASLTLEHQGKEYVITRELDYICSKIPTEVSTPYPSILTVETEVGNGEWRQVPLDIDSILPSELSDYFFFDGEKIAASTTKTNVEQSINAIMGLVPLKEMIDHLNPSSTSSVYQQMDRNRRKDDPSGQIIPLNRELEIARRSLESSKDREDREKTLKNALFNDFKDALTAFSNVREIAGKQNKLSEISRSIDDTSKMISATRDELFSTFTPMMMEHYMKMLSSQLITELESYNIIDKGIPDITAKSIRFILNRGKCACGCDLSLNEKSKTTLEELLRYVPPESIGSQVTQLKNDLGFYINSTENTTLFNNKYGSYKRETESLHRYSTEKMDLLREIGTKGSNAMEIRKNYEDCEKKYNESDDRLKSYGAQVLKWKKVVTEKENMINALSKSAGVNTKLDQELAYVRALYSRAIDEYNDRSVEILGRMRETLKTVFTDMYHGKEGRSILLSDDYKISLLAGGSALDASKGLETVKNFAFISALLKVAKERANSNLELSAEPYPLVMDAVFSNTDQKHIQNICKELPKMAEQAILAIMDKDWKYAKTSLLPYVGKAYRINKISETETHIMEVTLDDS